MKSTKTPTSRRKPALPRTRYRGAAGQAGGVHHSTWERDALPGELPQRGGWQIRTAQAHRAGRRQKMPYIRIVDMRMEAAKKSSILSENPLPRSAVQDRWPRRNKTILFLNRRGFDLTDLLGLRLCLPMPELFGLAHFHRAQSRIICHICNHTALPTKCPECRDPHPLQRHWDRRLRTLWGRSSRRPSSSAWMPMR